MRFGDYGPLGSVGAPPMDIKAGLFAMYYVPSLSRVERRFTGSMERGKSARRPMEKRSV